VVQVHRRHIDAAQAGDVTDRALPDAEPKTC
jgi:hypothetical protein